MENVVREVSQRPTAPRRNLFTGTQQRLAVYGNIAGHHLHIFNDTPGRIEQALASGYSFVKKGELELEASRRVVDTNSAVDGNVRYVVGQTEGNEAMYGYLLKIPEEFHRADQKEMQDTLNTAEAQMLRNGGAASDRLLNSYVPNGRRNALEIKRT